MNLSEEAKAFLEDNKIRDYHVTLNRETNEVEVNVNQYVDIILAVKKFPMKFGVVDGTFNCSHNKLTSLEGSPRAVNGSFLCYRNKLTSLVNAPEIVKGDFYCYFNMLTSLEGAPRTIDGIFSCCGNLLTSLEHVPSEVNNCFNCRGNCLTSLHDVHKHIKTVNGVFYCDENPIKDSVLGLLLINGIQEVFIDNVLVQAILNKYLGKGRGAVLDAQRELIEAGLDEFARL